jgi:GWxTD domain-containing protein
MNVRRFTTAIAALLIVAASAFAADKAPAPQKSFHDWGDSPQALFLTHAERLQWETLLSQAEADAFIANYWARHGQAFHDLVMGRIAAADKYFALGERKGSETDRGRVFIILGAPNREQSNRADPTSHGIGDLSSHSSIEERAVVGRTWTYKSDRLPKELGRSELIVKFQTDVSRGYEIIENPGLVEDYLTRAAESLVNNWKAAPATAPANQAAASQQQASAPAVTLSPTDEVVWNAAALNGAYITGEPFISPTDKPFYAVNFYLPKSFVAPESVILAGVVRDATGTQLLSVRTQSKPVQYDASGDRFVDASFELPAGHYTGAFALATDDGHVASAKNEFDVMPAEHVGVSRVLLMSRIDTLDAQKPFDPFTFVAMRYAVKGDRRFRPADKIGFFTFLSNPTATPQPSVTLRMKVTKDGKVIDNGAWMPVEVSQTGPHAYLLATQFEPNSFSPGHYTLEVRIRDTKADKDSEAFKGYVKAAEFDVVKP